MNQNRLTMLQDVWFHFIPYDHSLSQELLVAELKNLGAKGRKSLVEAWSQYLPKYGDPPFKLAHDGSNGPSGGHAPPGQPNGGSAAGSNGGGGAGGAGSEESTAPSEDEDADEEDDEDDANSSAVQAKRNQVTQKIAIFAAVQSKK